MAPAHSVLRVCPDCDAAFRKSADDRSTTAEDDNRLVRMALAVGGETWRSRDAVYWFRNDPRKQAGRCRRA